MKQTFFVIAITIALIALFAVADIRTNEQMQDQCDERGGTLVKSDIARYSFCEIRK